jgi:hypothetical protein
LPIALLRLSNWTRGRRSDREVSDPSLADVRDAIDALDGQERNDVYLVATATAPTPYLCVGGGAGRYLVTGVAAEDRFPTLVDPDGSAEPEVLLRVGGQDGAYPGNWIHTLETAMRAAEHFWETGQFGGAGLTWRDS